MTKQIDPYKPVAKDTVSLTLPYRIITNERITNKRIESILKDEIEGASLKSYYAQAFVEDSGKQIHSIVKLEYILNLPR
jgi:hypothetical protein